MILSNLDIDLLQEALLILLRDKYAMPNNYDDFKKKYNLVSDMYDRLKVERSNNG